MQWPHTQNPNGYLSLSLSLNVKNIIINVKHDHQCYMVKDFQHSKLLVGSLNLYEVDISNLLEKEF